jgi:hypothetical protein
MSNPVVNETHLCDNNCYLEQIKKISQTDIDNSDNPSETKFYLELIKHSDNPCEIKFYLEFIKNGLNTEKNKP